MRLPVCALVLRKGSGADARDRRQGGAPDRRSFERTSNPFEPAENNAGRTARGLLILAQHEQTGCTDCRSLLLCSLPSLAQKKVPPKAIRFQGAPQYTQEELLAAAGLKPGARLNSNDVKAHAKQLNDTGLFAVVKFSNDSKGLLFSLTPSSQLFPMHLDNLPLKPGKELDDKLHERFPLYHGLLPANGSMLEGIRQTFEEMLAAQGVKATVKAALTSGLGPQKITAMNFTVTSPAVRIGPIQLSGVSAAMQAKANALVSRPDRKRVRYGELRNRSSARLRGSLPGPGLCGRPSRCDPDRSSHRLGSSRRYSLFGHDQGRRSLQARLDQLSGRRAVPRAEVEKILSKYPAGSGRPLDLFLLAVRDAYHARGYLDCSIVSHPSFNEATHIVNYSLDIAPGPLYRHGRGSSSTAPPMPWPPNSRASGRWRPATHSTKATSQASRRARKSRTNPCRNGCKPSSPPTT